MTQNSVLSVPPATDISSDELAYRASLRYFLGPIIPFFDDPSVSEIMVNGIDRIYVERRGRLELTDARFSSDDRLEAAANNIAQFVGQTISSQRPLLDARLPDGSRVCIVLSPISGRGISMNIRRFSAAAVTPDFLLEHKAITPQALEFILLAVRAHQNIIVSGGTGSGKTTLLNMLSTAFEDDQRIVVIEDTRELQVQKEHVVTLEARHPDAQGRGGITIRDLFVTSLRMRPDRIIVGEIRRGESLDMVQAMTSGHRGCMATCHANTPHDACRRIETMALLADVGIPLFALRSQIASAIDLVVQTARLYNGRRIITHISEVAYDETNQAYLVTDLFNLVGTAGELELRWTGQSPALAGELMYAGLMDTPDLTRAMFDAKPRGSA